MEDLIAENVYVEMGDISVDEGPVGVEEDIGHQVHTRWDPNPDHDSLVSLFYSMAWQISMYSELIEVVRHCIEFEAHKHWNVEQYDVSDAIENVGVKVAVWVSVNIDTEVLEVDHTI